MARTRFAAGLAVLPLLLVAGTALAEDESRFLSQAVPASLGAGSSTSVSVTFMNTGTTSWTVPGGYTLACPDAATAATWEVDTVGLPGPVEVGTSVTFTFRVTAPTTPGTYNFQWRMQRGTTFFGAASPNVPIKVFGRPGAANPAAPPA
jgi:hypothetical protein